MGDLSKSREIFMDKNRIRNTPVRMKRINGLNGKRVVPANAILYLKKHYKTLYNYSTMSKHF